MSSILASLLLLLGASLAVSTDDGNARGWLLPNNTQPLHYTLHITTQIHRGIYEYIGNSTIEVEVLEPTDELVLNAANLNISEIIIRQIGSDVELACVTHELAASHELLIIKRSADCAQSSWSLTRYQRLSVTILFAAQIGDGMMGFNKIKTEYERTVFGAGTMLETSSARNAFPCYDQPNYKVNVTLIISHGANYTVYSNMPIERQAIHAENPDMLTTHFLTTPPIATYLIAFIISKPLKSLTRSSHGIQHRMLWLPDQRDIEDNNASTARTLLKISIDALALISDYFDQPYVLPKLDHFAWPHFEPNGMENWGLITYQASYLYLRENFTNSEPILTIVHEILHQWFGNLVTPQSWSDVWLSEGFATYYSFYFTDLLYPKLSVTQTLDTTCDSSQFRKLNLTILGQSEAPDDLNEHLQAVMYDRAPCVLQTFVHAFGVPVLQSALRVYLAANKYGHGTTSKFVDALQSAIIAEHAALNQSWQYDLTTILNSWLSQPNYPVVNVRRDYRSDQLHITQTSIDANAKQRWWLPLNIETRTSNRLTAQKQQKATLFMPAIEEFIYELSETHNFKSRDWYLLNAEGKSFYSVNYDVKNWRRLINALHREPRDFTLNTRISLPRNLWLACQTQTLGDPLLLLQMLDYLRHEPDVRVIDQMHEIFFRAQVTIFETTEYEELFSKFYLYLLETHKNDLAGTDLNMYRKFLLKRKPLNDTAFEQRFSHCKQLNDAADCFQCYRSLTSTHNEAHFERLLDEVYRIANASESQCLCKLKYIAESTSSSMSIDRNLTWLKLANDFASVLDQATCDIDVWAEHILREADEVDVLDLSKVLRAIDVYNEHTEAQTTDETLGDKFLRSHSVSQHLSVSGIRRWFFKHVNHTKLHNFFLDVTNAIETP